MRPQHQLEEIRGKRKRERRETTTRVYETIYVNLRWNRLALEPGVGDEWSVTANIIKFRSWALKHKFLPAEDFPLTLCPSFSSSTLSPAPLDQLYLFGGVFLLLFGGENCHLNLKTIWRLAYFLLALFHNFHIFNFTHKHSFLGGEFVRKVGQGLQSLRVCLWQTV